MFFFDKKQTEFVHKHINGSFQFQTKYLRQFRDGAHLCKAFASLRIHAIFGYSDRFGHVIEHLQYWLGVRQILDTRFRLVGQDQAIL